MAHGHRVSLRSCRAAARLTGLLWATGCFDEPLPVDPGTDDTTGRESASTGQSDGGPGGSGADPTVLTEADATSPATQTGSDDSGSDTAAPAACGDGIVAPGELCWGEVATIEGGGEAASLYAAHFDGDGDLDLVISSPTSATLFLGDGAGGFVVQTPLTTIESGVGSGDLALARLDAGETIDLVASNGFTTIAGLLGDGVGGFGSPVESTVPGVNAYGLVPGDYTNDGIIDVLVTRLSGYDVYFGVGVGNGTFTFTSQFAVEQTEPMLAGDFDGDGNLDAVFGQGATQSLTWLRGSGTDAMTPEDLAIGIALVYGEPAGADLDADGTDDGVFPIAETDQVAVVLGGLGIGPTAPVLLDTTGEPTAAAIADLDHDGTLDVASCGRGLFAALSVWRGDGAGGFGAVDELSVTPCAHLVLGDFDDDGADDVAYHEGGPGGLRIILAEP
jgi:hypothetical protein